MDKNLIDIENLSPNEQLALADAFYQFGKKQYDANLLDKAKVAYTFSVKLNPKHIPALEGLVIIHMLTQQFEQAETYALQLIALDNANFTALLQLMQINSSFKKYRRIKKYMTLLAKYHPKNFRLLQEQCAFAAFTCDFQLQEKVLKNLIQHNYFAIENNKTNIEHRFCSIPDRSNKPFIFALDKLNAQKIVVQESPFKHSPFSYITTDKITIGYVSDDFIDHPVAHLICDLFKEHDRSKFKVNIYNYSEEKNDYFLNTIKNSCDKYTNIRNLSNIEAAKLINQDHVDILIDLKGHTTNSRLGIFYHRPAPVQITFLGEAASTGADFIDYIIADEVAIPPEDYQYFTEKVLLMDRSYRADSGREIFKIPEGDTRATYGLPNDAFIFGCFNLPYKINLDYLNACFAILKSVENSILWMYRENRYMQYNICKYAETCGINLERIIFAPKLPKDKHLARIKHVDLMLDTFLCHGHTTTGDALFFGIPVLTLHGTYLASRISSSYLTTFGMPELICYDLDEFKQKAIDYATHPAEYKKLASKVKKQVNKSPLFDMKDYCRSLEKALLTTVKND